MTQASNRDHWEPVNSSGLYEFRDMYGGARGRAALKNVLARPPLERFLHFRQTAVQNLFDLSLPDGLFFVREEYLLLADRLRKARKEKKTSELQGCLLLGQQGVGKSHFLLLLLVQCLTREETVLFTSYHGDTYLFDEDGIVRTRTGDISCTHLPEDFPDPSDRLWSLVDCSRSKGTISSSVTYAARQLFFVAATRPDLSHGGDLKERFNVRQWWMSHLTENELRALLAALPPGQFPLTQSGRYPLSSPDTARSLLRDVGHSLQDILLYLKAPDRYENLVNTALLQYTNVENIYRLLSGLDLSTNPEAHRLVVISRAGPVAPDALEIDDRAVAHFKTRKIHSRVLANTMALSLEDTQHLYASFRANGGPGDGPFASASSKLLFENMAFRYARYERDFWSPRGFAPFRHPYQNMPWEPQESHPGHRVHMTRAQTASPAAVRFLYQSDADRGWPTTVSVSDLEPPSAVVVWRLSHETELDRSDVLCSQFESEPWNVHPQCGARTWPSVAALCAAVAAGSDSSEEAGPGVPWTAAVGPEDLDGAFCYASGRSEQRALFDAYSLRVNRYKDQDYLWAIRVATPGRNSGCSAMGDVAGGGELGAEADKGGFADIVRLKEAVREAYVDEERPVKISYALIVPYGDPMFGVEWSLPAAGLEEHPGHVYVQFLDVSAFGGDVAQVLGVPRPDASKAVDDAPHVSTSRRVTSKRGGKRKRDEARY